MSRHNIVQVEFFHVGGLGDRTLDGVITHCAERTREGSKIKTTVRIFDINDALTELVCEYAILKKTADALLHGPFKQALAAPPSLQRSISLWWYEHRHWRTTCRLKRLRARIVRIALSQLRELVWVCGAVATENADRSFRLLSRDEAGELIESATAAVGAWIFVFEQNDLYADINHSVASMIG